MSQNLDIEFLIQATNEREPEGQNGREHSAEPEDLDFIVTNQANDSTNGDNAEAHLDFDINEEALSLSKSLDEVTSELDSHEDSDSNGTDESTIQHSEFEETNELSTEFETLLEDLPSMEEETATEPEEDTEAVAEEHSLVLPQEVLREDRAASDVLSDDSDEPERGEDTQTVVEGREKSEDLVEPEPEPSAQVDPAEFKKRVGLKFDPLSLISSGPAVGLDFGASALKYVELKRSPAGIKVVNCGSYSMHAAPEESEERAVSRILKERFNRKAIRKSILTTAVSGLEVWFKNIQVPEMSKSKLKKAVPWACRKDLPFPLEESRVEFSKNSARQRSDEKTDVFVVAAQEKVISEHIELLRDADLKPARISTIPVALCSLFNAIDMELPHCCGFVDIGTAYSHIAFVKDGELQFARQVATGGKTFTQAITGSIFVDGNEIELTPERAEDLKRRYGFPEVDSKESTEDDIPLKELAVMMQPVLEKLISDIQRTRDFFEEKFRGGRVEKIYLTGGGALLKNLPEILSQEFSCAVQIFNPFDHISLKKFNEPASLKTMGPRFAVAAGLALDRDKDLNLLPPKMKGAFLVQQLKRAAGFLIIIAFLLMLFFTRRASEQINDIQQEKRQMNEQYSEIKPKRERFLSLQQQLASLQKSKQDLRSKLEMNLSAAGHLKVLSNIWPTNLALTALKIPDISDNKQQGEADSEVYESLILEGVAFENNSREGMDLAQFIFRLEEMNYFSAISLKSQTIKPDGSLFFKIECKI